MMLSVGAKGSLASIKAAWLKLNNDIGHPVKTSQSAKKPRQLYESICYSTDKKGWRKSDGCKAHIFAKGDTADNMEVISIDTYHTCEKVVQRKRNYGTSDIATMSSVFDVYQPTATRDGNTRQIVQMTKAATGVTLKVGQANAYIHKKSNDTLEAQLGQYMLLPSLYDTYKRLDRDGTYLLESVVSPWDRSVKQFSRSYASLSFIKTFWDKAQMDLVICDGTFTKVRLFKHILLIAVTFDGNNMAVILAYAVVDVENADNWTWFKECLEQDFPGIRVWMSDADKGIYSEQFSLSLSQSDEMKLSRCIRHLAENCKLACNGPMNENNKKLIGDLAKQRTARGYSVVLEEINSINKQWASYLNEKREQFATYCFLQQGYMRYGKVTSNGVEVINGSIMDIRHLPILYLTESMIQYQREKFLHRKAEAAKWIEERRLYTRYAEDIIMKWSHHASKKDVEVVHHDCPVYKARVSVGTATEARLNLQYVTVAVNVETYTADCECKYHDEMGIPCPHIIALLIKVNRRVTKEWVHKRYRAVTYFASHSATVPTMTFAGSLSIDKTFSPPDYKKPAGRPQKKRKYYSNGTTKCKCKACGELGHFAVSCPKPSTQFQYSENKEKAVDWIKKARVARAEM
jgi:MULE transposase domain/SWIM zinc finger